MPLQDSLFLPRSPTPSDSADQDACKENDTACASEFDAYSKCLAPYCMKNAAACQAAIGGLGSDET